MAQTQYTGKNALTYIFTIIKNYVTGQLATKVDKDGSKVLSDNNYTTTEKEKLAGIEASAQVNKLESVKVNGVAQLITDKAVDVTVPTAVSQLTNDSNYVNQSKLTEELAKKQDTLTAGSNITIQGNVISASGEILNSVAWDNITGDIANNTALQEALTAKANASDLTAHTGNADIHVTSSDKQTWNAKLDASAIADMATKTELALKANSADVYTKTEIDDKGYQNASQIESAITAKGYTTMSAVEGKGYQTSEQVQSAINDAVGDLTGVEFTVVEELPQTGEAGVIYLVAHEHGTGDGYDEYIYLTEQTKFEKIGNTDIDLSGYVLTTDLVEITNEEVQTIWDGVFTA